MVLSYYYDWIMLLLLCYDYDDHIFDRIVTSVFISILPSTSSSVISLDAFGEVHGLGDVANLMLHPKEVDARAQRLHIFESAFIIVPAFVAKIKTSSTGKNFRR